MSEVWTRLSVAYLLFVQSVFDPCLDNISYLLSNDVTATSLLKILQCARLDIEHDIRVCLSRIPPRLDKLCSAKQAQPSHWTEHCIMNILLVNTFGDCLIFETEVLSVCAMTFGCCVRNLAFSRIQVVWVRILIRHVLAQQGVRKVEASAPWAVGSATRTWNFCGVHSVTKVENLWSIRALKLLIMAPYSKLLPPTCLCLKSFSELLWEVRVNRLTR